MLDNGASTSCLAETVCERNGCRSSLEPSVGKRSNGIVARKRCRNITSGANANGDSSGNSIAVSKKQRYDCSSADLSDERILVLIAHRTNWNPFLLCLLSCVCKKTSAISDRLLWRQFCLSRAPKMVTDLLLGAKNGRIDGGWRALGKLFLYCAGCSCSPTSTRFPSQSVAGHFVPTTRFSQTSGRFFLLSQCRTDVLYVSDPCEHTNSPEDVGIFRGVFRGFDRSLTKRLLTLKGVPLCEERCPYCQAGVWSMGSARMIPRSASAKLAAYNENVEYFVCLNGHVNGRCALLHLSDSDDYNEDE